MSKGKRKRLKKQNRKKNLGDETNTSLSVNTSLNGSTTYLSSDDDDTEEPPAKSLKTKKEMVPNPLAVKKSILIKSNNGVSTPSSKKNAEKTSDLVKQSKAKTPTNGVGVVSMKPKPVSKNSEKPSSSSSQAAKQNGGLPPKKPNTPKQNPKTKSTSAVSTSSSTSFPFTITSKVPPLEIKSIFPSSRIEDSTAHSKQVLNWLLHPVTSDEFMKTYWEKKPLLIKRKHPDSQDYYKPILTTQLFDDMLRRLPIKYGVNLDITSYKNGKRETISDNLQGRVRPAVVWDYYNNECSIRMLNPQTYIQPLWRLNSSLQEWFGSFVGANMYLTPSDSQGFAPHYDDIDAFILQIEGKKRWKLYNSRNEDEVLPRFSSPNFSEENDNLGEPILDVVLEEGDLLYFPRGVIHQAQTVDGEHSLTHSHENEGEDDEVESINLSDLPGEDDDDEDDTDGDFYDTSMGFDTDDFGSGMEDDEEEDGDEVDQIFVNDDGENDSDDESDDDEHGDDFGYGIGVDEDQDPDLDEDDEDLEEEEDVDDDEFDFDELDKMGESDDESGDGE